MIIILEGENKCGKTTLANYIVKQYGFKYIKCSQPKGDPYLEYMEILKSNKKNIVLDRFLIGEPVYGKLYRGKSGLSDAQIRNIELKALALNAFIIYCFDDVKNIAAKFDTEGEEFAKKRKIKMTLDLFERQLKKSILPIFRHKMLSKLDLLSTGLIDVIIKQKMKNNIMKTVIGNVNNPSLVIVGDTCNKNSKIFKQYLGVQQPFDFGPSSNFLFNSLKSAKVDLRDVAILNSDSPELDYIIKKKNQNVIALGNNSAGKLKDHKIGFSFYYHPNYENRFKHNSSEFYKFLRQQYEKLS